LKVVTKTITHEYDLEGRVIKTVETIIEQEQAFSNSQNPLYVPIPVPAYPSPIVTCSSNSGEGV
jgi:hypothetical protein